ncbi:bifunctional proline dehydrogenase/L-glutamate gamma-semialdehyde dehydrogenase PutA [Kordiimonas sp. SCSIO 12603]|uniref:bifunctional proline dehydrogenase/L-glutamate gamma-semialdehyde dehydrogenase PutA n=1 Tax=Kordiimonas sp. SCSIO 12603 TaxID=2829596 RepID=UPI002107E8B6|nr:bifunctional proline dehydrogenase/L-glutamate gamma-semialdehyde dehydrogenase PutA [Kordiimonas sp. SCSIO 12603]UTW58158.1 bifunctional proline dehydrogenase/L-glutamate gamma-semialdehyde dehydrogenase PutA [Kordiimonas sp. SCSIO 12603]
MTNLRISPAAAPNKASALAAMREAYELDETKAVQRILENFPLDDSSRKDIAVSAAAIVAQSRAMKEQQGSLDAFLAEFGLSNQEGVALMCLAEALLRVPDTATQDKLIAEKIQSGDWSSHKGQSDSTFVNASTWALMLTGGVIDLDKSITKNPGSWVKSLIGRTGEPVIRAAVNQAMKIMGKQFVFGRTIGEGLTRQGKQAPEHKMMSFDMLGEGARTMETAHRYYDLYKASIDAVGSATKADGDNPHDRSSVSIKLSALHPCYNEANEGRVMAEMLPMVKDLAVKAKSYDIQMTIDAEEADRLDISLRLFEKLAQDPDLAGWEGLGLAVQAYQKRAPYVIDWLIHLARENGRKFAVRLVKGAYWDTEIKHAQELGLDDYPVFTRKPSTDCCYLYTAARMLDAQDAIYPQFATHNAHTIAAISAMAEDKYYEFQRLHGMGELLYTAASKVVGRTIRTRTYAPVGLHEDLLPYLVRRLLENGANSSFVNRFMDAEVPVEEVAGDPIESLKEAPALRHTLIPTPLGIYGEERLNSKGCNLMDRNHFEPLLKALDERKSHTYAAMNIVGGMEVGGKTTDVRSPVNTNEIVGTFAEARIEDIETAAHRAAEAQHDWDALGGKARADILRKAADLLEEDRDIVADMLVREAGKTLGDIIAEVREAVDFFRYYAVQAEKQFGEPIRLPGPTGEQNELHMGGRGTFLCIAPWNFPLAIFVGQIAAALAAGNSVIAKPAEQTPIIAWHAVKLMHKAGVPADVLHLLLGDGATVGAKLVADERIAGVAFTGSTETAKIINRTLADRDGAIVPLIAETGGQNAMIVDSTALPEQVADDVILSAFGSAGQRCSALRVLFVQDSVADKVIDMIKGALKERVIGNPANLDTDIGPIIDEEARANLAKHCAKMEKEATLVAKAEMADDTKDGTFFAPHIFELSGLDQLEREVFGPVLHIIRFKSSEMEDVLKQILDTGYGLTFGVHSRLEGRWQELFAKTRVGNTYINRNMTGAVVGVQPFGGEGLSGTGPKAGGPNYLIRFAAERTLTINTAAVGGNAELFSMDEGA